MADEEELPQEALAAQEDENAEIPAVPTAEVDGGEETPDQEWEAPSAG